MARWWAAGPDWWEARRLPYNAFVGVLGCVALRVFFIAITESGELKPRQDAVEPLALLAAPVLANVAYTFGSITEVLVNLVRGSGARRVGPALLHAGLVFSAVVVLAPAAFWSTAWAIHAMHR